MAAAEERTAQSKEVPQTLEAQQAQVAPPLSPRRAAPLAIELASVSRDLHCSLPCKHQTSIYAFSEKRSGRTRLGRPAAMSSTPLLARVCCWRRAHPTPDHSRCGLHVLVGQQCCAPAAAAVACAPGGVCPARLHRVTYVYRICAGGSAPAPEAEAPIERPTKAPGAAPPKVCFGTPWHARFALSMQMAAVGAAAVAASRQA